MFSSEPAREPRVFTLRADNGIAAEITDVGAAIRSLSVPVSDGELDIVLGYESPNDYLHDSDYLGSTLGRYANRIGGARLRLSGEVFTLDANERRGNNCLHGGPRGFNRQFWDIESGSDGCSLRCSLRSPDGDQGFPGELDVTVKYSLPAPYSLAIDFAAQCDSETVVNLANHVYFNLDARAGSIDNHVLQLNAPFHTPVDESRIPTGRIEPVVGTPYDLTTPQYLADAFTGLSRVLDQYFVLPYSGGALREAANLYSPDSGLRLVVHTTQPGLQVCTGDHLAKPFKPRAGICLEAQNFPDAPNHPDFPSARLRPGERYAHRTVYEFIPPLE